MTATITTKLSRDDIKSLVKESVREALGEELQSLRAYFAHPKKVHLEERMSLDEELRLWDEAGESDFSKFVKEMKL